MKIAKEWNISYVEHDGYGGLTEGMVVLPSLWKVWWWVFTKAHRYCEIYVWTSYRWRDERSARG